MQIKVKRRLPEQIFMSQIYLMVKMEQQIFASSLKSSTPVMTLDSSDTQKQSEAVVRSRLQKYGANEYEESKTTAVDILGLNHEDPRPFLYLSPPPRPHGSHLCYVSIDRSRS